MSDGLLNLAQQYYHNHTYFANFVHIHPKYLLQNQTKLFLLYKYFDSMLLYHYFLKRENSHLFQNHKNYYQRTNIHTYILNHPHQPLPFCWLKSLN